MAFATQNSVEYQQQLNVKNQVGSSMSLQWASPQSLEGLTVKYAPFSFEYSGSSDTGELNLVTLAPGAVRVFTGLSKIVTSQFATDALVHIGYRAFVQPDLTSVPESFDAFVTGLAAGSEALDQTWTSVGYVDLETKGPTGITVFLTVDTGNLEADDTIYGYVAYATMVSR